jgi:hypothetical protein
VHHFFAAKSQGNCKKSVSRKTEGMVNKRQWAG